MQDAGKKTSENAISVEDFDTKSLFNTLFMMFNSRYMVQPWKMVSPTFSLRRFGRMYYILKEGTPIKRFAGFSDENTGDAPGSKEMLAGNLI